MNGMRKIVYAICMIAAILVVGYLAADGFLPQLPVQYSSNHPASTVPPMRGFASDSLINVGDAEDLDDLPGVGVVISQRIVETRDVLGGFRIPEDLLLVKGIGEKTLSKIMEILEESLENLQESSE